jgi:glycopeptide antibiotics resistance protein
VISFENFIPLVILINVCFLGFSKQKNLIIEGLILDESKQCTYDIGLHNAN